MAKVLALDLGTNTGFCVGTNDHMVSGSWSLKPGRYDGGGMRFVKFRTRLDEIRSAYGVTQVFFEEVRRHAGTDAAHVYGGLMATLQAWCEENDIPYDGIPVGTWKKRWCGAGNGSKETIRAECERRGIMVGSFDEADAVAIFHSALAELGLLSDE